MAQYPSGESSTAHLVPVNFQVLLLDEVTVDLDVVTRMDLLEFFREECEQVFTVSIYLPAETHGI